VNQHWLQTHIVLFKSYKTQCEYCVHNKSAWAENVLNMSNKVIPDLEWSFLSARKFEILIIYTYKST